MKKPITIFPCGTIFLCVVDPGVGTQRDALCLEIDSYVFFGPNNGLFNALSKAHPGCKIYRIDEHVIKPTSTTFHGRDLFVPAAIAYVQGRKNFLQEISANELSHIAHSYSDYIAYIDSFGNIKTTIKVDTKLPDTVTLLIQNKEYAVPFVKTFGNVEPDKLLCYKGSNGTLEIAVNRGSAKSYLNAEIGNEVKLL